MPLSILVVDDDELLLDCVTQQLAHFGHIVHGARSGAEAAVRQRSAAKFKIIVI